ncbi:winged helix-turn-helix domain-containing protein [Streptosporangium lutulentum]
MLATLDGPMSTTELAGRLGVTPSAVSQHLKVLLRSGLLTRSRARPGRALRPNGGRGPADGSMTGGTDHRGHREQPVRWPPRTTSPPPEIRSGPTRAERQNGTPGRSLLARLGEAP